ncbi:hypothetical protein LF296_15355 [Acinetobacter vivianii]|uniref:DUF600 family protein n=1 Tax=Acinetobacter vivianii TaxID=1776742 RepID=A0AAJ6NHW5_9GAMM|nr:hypothetical protein [Acinetobacter vivianii]MBJ8483995.1 hypothetical protein [Acinetobacter vivianii]WDZ50670.1 hypothetical protein LF296_15355 [Acinetobacter vivianii]
MIFLRKSELISSIFQEIAFLAVSDWQKIVYYTERFRDKNIGLRNKDTALCWVGENLKLYTDDYPLRSSMEPYKTINILFEECEKSDDIWCGLSLFLDHQGKYSSKFYYEGTPLLDGNDAELSKRLAEINP